MRADSWPGLVTNASPFAIPPGAAVEQTNLTANIPGQIAARSGMRKVSSTASVSTILDCYPYVVDGRTVLVAMNANGELVSLGSPAYGDDTPPATDPALASASGSTQTSYTYQYANPDVPSVAARTPPTTTLVSALNGGEVGTTAPPYIVDAMSACAVEGTVEDVDGGSASDDSPESSLMLSELCPL